MFGLSELGDSVKVVENPTSDDVAFLLDLDFDFLILACGYDKWVAPVGFPRRIEHF